MSDISPNHTAGDMFGFGSDEGVETVTLSDALSGEPKPNGQAKTAKKDRPGLSNLSNKIPLPLAEIRKYLSHLTGGWPKVAAGALCYRKKDPTTGRVVPGYVKDVADLFAWIDRYAQVTWSEAANCPTKTEFLRHLEQRCKQYAWATDLPHSPPLPNVLYTNKPPEPASTGRLDELVDLFDLHTEVDRYLVKAFVLTPFWGGPPRKRPLFAFATAEGASDPAAGRGAGKSTIAQVVGHLAGGYFSLRKESDVDRVLSDLVSSNGLGVRMVLMDNVKSLKFSSSFIESMITATQIDGHRLFQGHATRPNYVTYVLTANEPMLSTDLAKRCILILVNQAKKSPAWDKKLESMLEDQHFLQELYADILWHLQLPTKGAEGGAVSEKGEEYDRWSLWWHEVASRVCPDEAPLEKVMATAKKRQGQVDADLSEREQVVETLAGVLVACGVSAPEGVAAFFPTRVLTRVLKDVFGRDATVIEVGRRLKNMQLPGLKYTRNGPPGKQSGYWWVGIHSAINVVRGLAQVFVEDNATPRGYRCDCLSNMNLVKELLASCAQPKEASPTTEAGSESQSATESTPA